MRAPSATDFSITLPDVGDFTFGRRTMGDFIKIRSEYLKLIDENENDDDQQFYVWIIASYKILCVSCPAGWEDIAALDINVIELNTVVALGHLLSEKESSFRRDAQG